MSDKDKTKAKKRMCVSSLVLGIIGVLFSSILPVVTYCCAIPGIIIGVKKHKNNYNSAAGLTLGIAGLSIAVINSVISIIITFRMYITHSRDKKSALAKVVK